mmetsp:Transcript_33491/g.110730  ORF Transcript_33491/g.110730 Transcript_33491/m.110730 type:complete len:130 (+) Transcript_33491:235-624(+)
MFRGEWASDRASGFGVLLYANNNRYEGAWLDDKRHGHGAPPARAGRPRLLHRPLAAPLPAPSRRHLQPRRRVALRGRVVGGPQGGQGHALLCKRRHLQRLLVRRSHLGAGPADAARRVAVELGRSVTRS